MCGTIEILMKNVRFNRDPNEKCAVQLKSVTSPWAPEILGKKLHKKSSIPGTPENPAILMKKCAVQLKSLTSPGPLKIVETKLKKRATSPGHPKILEKPNNIT